MKIRAGAQFQIKNPNIIIANIKHNAAILLACCRYNNKAPPNATNTPSLPAKPSIPSIKLYKFNNHTKANVVKTVAKVVLCKTKEPNRKNSTGPNIATAQMA